MIQLAVVIVSWNVRELLRTCLLSLFDDLESSRISADIWIVDNASADGTADMVTASYPSCHLIASPVNVGFAAGNNLALRQILGSDPLPEFLWLLNPDTQLREGAIRALLAGLREAPDVGVAGAKLLNPDGSLQHGAFRFPGLLQLAFELFPLPLRLYETSLNGRYPWQQYEGIEPFFIDHPLGASMLVRSSCIQDIGLLDEGYQMYCEEIDWCWRMRRVGWRAICVPAAEITHVGGQSTSQVPVSSFINLWSSRARLYSRHHGRLVRSMAKLLVLWGMRRRMAASSPEMAAACVQVIETWGRAL